MKNLYCVYYKYRATLEFVGYLTSSPDKWEKSELSSAFVAFGKKQWSHHDREATPTVQSVRQDEFYPKYWEIVVDWSDGNDEQGWTTTMFAVCLEGLDPTDS